MTVIMHAVALTPFLMHVFTSIGLLSHIGAGLEQMKHSDSWTAAVLDCYRLGPWHGELTQLFAYVQLVMASVAMVTHFIGNADLRKISYAILAGLYAVTQIRHVMSSPGPVTIGYLYTHIAVFSILILYQDTINYKLTSTQKK